MFYHLNGIVTDIDINLAVIDCSGVGYAVNTTTNTLSRLKIGDKSKVYISECIKEDSFELYGFATVSEKRCFEMLLTVSGIGPKAALSVLSEFTPDSFALAVASGDAKAITRAKGIGPKAAQRIILELHDKISGNSAAKGFSAPAVSVANIHGAAGEAIAAMVSLGYTNAEAAAVIAKLPQDLPVDEMIKRALKSLAMGR